MPILAPADNPSESESSESLGEVDTGIGDEAEDDVGVAVAKMSEE